MRARQSLHRNGPPGQGAVVTVSCRGETDVQGGDGLTQCVGDAVAVTRRGHRQEFCVG
jgi:hypothetical protein